MLMNIQTERLHPHPHNPRKDLWDLTELAGSIQVNGVLQNLTVVPADTALYPLLIKLGYGLSDEENALQDGTHTLYQIPGHGLGREVQHLRQPQQKLAAAELWPGVLR